jgi:hypothetical protein
VPSKEFKTLSLERPTSKSIGFDPAAPNDCPSPANPDEAGTPPEKKNPPTPSKVAGDSDAAFESLAAS